MCNYSRQLMYIVVAIDFLSLTDAINIDLGPIVPLDISKKSHLMAEKTMKSH